MPKWIDHIVVRVKDLDQSLKDYETKLRIGASKGPDGSTAAAFGNGTDVG